MTTPTTTFVDITSASDTLRKSEWNSNRSTVTGMERLQYWIVSAWSAASTSLDRLPETSPDSLGYRIKNRLSSQLHLWHLRYQIQRERKDLSELPEHLLSDIGISRNSANAEAVRKFTDIPANRVSTPDLL